MEISKLTLENYRNFANDSFEFSSQGCIISGENGSGKTNLLESICYCASGKSVQVNTDQELIHFEKDFFRIDADFTFLDKPLNIQCAVDKKQKKIKVNDVMLDKLSDLFRYIKIVYFSPSDVNIISGSPASRRAFLDQAISQFDFSYLIDLKQYNRILKQRNQLLKQDYSKPEKASWDIQYVEAADKIITGRLRYLNAINNDLTKFYNKISLNNEVLTNSYSFSYHRKNREDYKADLHDYLRSNEEKEVDQQRSIAGPHLDDLDFYLNEKSARRFASQGQKRSIAIAARFMQASMISSHNEYPILMFDDVLAELDQGRTERILSLLEADHQIFIATPNLVEENNSLNLPLLSLGNNNETT